MKALLEIEGKRLLGGEEKERDRTEAFAQAPPKRLLAIDPVSSFLYVASPSQACLASVLAFPLKVPASAARMTELRPRPASGFAPFAPVTILLNPTGAFLALVGADHAAVMDVSSESLGRRAAHGAECVCVPAVEVGAPFTRSRRFAAPSPTVPPGPAVIHAAWHPLAPAHLAVLTADNVIRVYNVTASAREPEQVFDVSSLAYSQAPAPHHFSPSGRKTPAPPLPRAVSFAFASPGATGWQALCLWVLFDNGAIGVLCPVLPFRVELPRDAFVELAGDTPESARTPMQEEAHRWLRDVCDFSASAEQRFRTRKPAWPKRLLVQGPIEGTESTLLADDASGFCDIAVLSGAPSLIVRSHSDGMVDSFISFSPVDPCWDIGTKLSQISDPKLVLVDQIDLALSPQVKRHIPRLPVVMTLNQSENWNVFVHHGDGVHSTVFDYLKDLREGVKSGAPGGLPKLSPPLVMNLLETVPPTDSVLGILGLSTFHDNVAGTTSLVTFASDGSLKVTCVAVPPPLPKLEATHAAHVSPAVEKAEVWSGPPPPALHFKLPLQPDDALAKLAEAYKKMRETHIVYLHSIVSEITLRNEAAKRLIDEMNSRLAAIPGALENIVRMSQKLEFMLDGISKKQEYFEQRISLLFETIALLRPELNRAEKEFFRELDGQPRTIAEVQSRMEELSQRTAELVSGAETTEDSDIRLTPAQLDFLSRALVADQEVIKTLVKRIKALKEEVERISERH